MSEETLLEFPCRFPIKVMGKATDEFHIEVRRIVREHIPELAEDCFVQRASAQSNYVAITVTIEATSREQLDNIYRSLTACELVLMAL